MRALLAALFVLLSTGALAGPDQPSMDWPLYRLGIHSEQWRMGLDEDPRYPWARRLAMQRGKPEGSIKEIEAALNRIERFEALAEARWHRRVQGPPPIDVWGEQKGVISMSRTICRTLWGQPAQRPAAFNALSEWDKRPTCLLQELPADVRDLAGQGSDTVRVAVVQVGDGKQTFTRLTGNPGSGEYLFRALYDPEGQLVSAQIETPAGWVMVTRDATGAMLVEWPKGKGAVEAELVFMTAPQGGQRGLDIGLVDPPPPPKVPAALVPIPDMAKALGQEIACPILDEGQTYLHPDGTFIGPQTQQVKLSGNVEAGTGRITLAGTLRKGRSKKPWRVDLTQVEVLRRGGMIFFAGREGVLACSVDGNLDRGIPRYPWVAVYDGGAGSQAVRDVRDILALTLAAEYEQRPDEVLVVGRGAAMHTLDHIEITYNDRQWSEEAWRLADSIRLTMPWAAVVVREWAAAEAPVTVSVGW